MDASPYDKAKYNSMDSQEKETMTDEENDEDEIAPSASKRFRNRLHSNDDDEVLQEVDVYINKNLSNSLYVLQFPLRPNDRSFDKNQQIDVKFKPIQEKLEMKFHLDTSNPNYDKSRGEQIAINCSTTKTSENTIFRKTMDYQIFVNNNVGGFHTGCYAIGYCKNRSLYLNPIKDILQMKPSFFYLDAADDKSRQAASTSNISHDGADSSQDEMEAESSNAVQAVRVKFDVEESDAMKKRRIASFSHLQKVQAEERWMNLRHKNFHNADSALLRKSLQSDLKFEEYPKFLSDSNTLMRLFVPKAEEDEISSPQLPSNVISLTQLRTLPLSDQVQAIMTNVKVIRFPQLLSLLPPKIDEQIVLKSLQHCAVLVQGCWVVKSDILYPRHAISPRTGISGDLLCKARDFALYKFTQSFVIGRKDITYAVKIPAEDLQEILNQLARFKCLRGWQFMYPTDTEFMQNHVDIVQRQNSLWEAKYQALAHQLNLRQRRISDPSRSPGRIRRRTGSQSTDAQMLSGEDDTSGGDGAGGRRRRRSSKASSGANKLTQLANGSSADSGTAAAVVDNNSSSALKMEFRKFLYEKLSARPVLSMSDVKRQLLLKLAESPPGHVLSKGISDLLVEQSASELGAVKIFNNKMTEPVFAYAGAGSWPDVRRVAIKVLEQKHRIRFNTFKQACAEALAELPNDNELRKILNEYCVQKNSLYSLIGT